MDKNLFNKINFIGISFQKYIDLTCSEVENTISSNLSEVDSKRYEDRKLNLHRMKRIDKHCIVSKELKSLIQSIKEPQKWMIITETWCGDSAQNIPYIAKIAELNSNITLKIILRDINPEIMDLYLTNGTRSIPILVVFNSTGQEIFQWGPRPEEAKTLLDKLKQEGVEKSVRQEKLHLWYGRNRGKNLENEITNQLITALSSFIN